MGQSTNNSLYSIAHVGTTPTVISKPIQTVTNDTIANQQINTLINANVLNSNVAPTTVSSNAVSLATNANNAINSVISPNVSQIAPLLSVIQTYIDKGEPSDGSFSGSQLKSIYTNPNNTDAIVSTLNLYGGAMPVPISGNSNNVDKGSPSMRQFLHTTLLFLQFPDFTDGGTTNDCAALQNYLTGLQNALIAQDAVYAADKSGQRDWNNAAITGAISALQTYYNGLNSKLGCSLYLQNQANVQNQQAIYTAAGITPTSQSGITQSSTSTTPNYLLYIGIFSVLIIGTVIIVKLAHKKD